MCIISMISPGLWKKYILCVLEKFLNQLHSQNLNVRKHSWFYRTFLYPHLIISTVKLLSAQAKHALILTYISPAFCIKDVGHFVVQQGYCTLYALYINTLHTDTTKLMCDSSQAVYMYLIMYAFIIIAWYWNTTLQDQLAWRTSFTISSIFLDDVSVYLYTSFDKLGYGVHIKCSSIITFGVCLNIILLKLNN